jgi:hypothetical protein
MQCLSDQFAGSEEVLPAVKTLGLELNALKVRMRAMEFQKNRRSQTTWAEKDVGEVRPALLVINPAFIALLLTVRVC